MSKDILQMNKISEVKLKEEGNNIYRNVENKLEKSKKDIQNLLAEFKNSVSISIKR